MKNIIIIIALAIIILLLEEKLKGNPENEKNQNNDPNYIKGAYQHKWMFTQNEKPAYFKLKEIADKHGLLLFAKVRLWDFFSFRTFSKVRNSSLARPFRRC